jgi:hypothetical protein
MRIIHRAAVAKRKHNKSKKQAELSLKLALRFRDISFSITRGYTQEYLDKVDLDPRKWFRMMEEGTNPTFHTLCEVAEALKIHPMELLNFDFGEKTSDEVKNSGKPGKLIHSKRK